MGKRLTWEVNGKCNVIEIGNHVKLNHVFVHVIGGGYCRIIIEDDADVNNTILRMDGTGNQIIIGSNTYIGGATLHAMGGTEIRLGKNCLLSNEIDIRSGDGHAIYELGNSEIYNKSKDIKIGNHVWIGKRAQILKGVRIEDESVIGAGSLVNKRFYMRNCVIAGVPARIIKEQIRWER